MEKGGDSDFSQSTEKDADQVFGDPEPSPLQVACFQLS